MKFSKERIKEQKAENMIVLLTMILALVFIFVIFGWSAIKTWISSPLFWKGQDKLDVSYISTVADTDSTEDYVLFLGIKNNTDKKIDEYDITIKVEGVTLTYDSDTYHHTGYSYYADNSISAIGRTTVGFTITTSKYPGLRETTVSTDTLNKLLHNKRPDSIDVSYKIKCLKSDGKSIVNNTGIIKNCIIILLSFGFGIFGFMGNIDKKWLRLLFKFLSLPAIIIIAALLILTAVAAYSASPEGQAAAEANRQKFEQEQKAKAAREYKSAAHTKAACIARGDYKGAAYAQERMDKSKADMISVSGSNKTAYKSAAHTKAACVARGDHKGAAYAQAKMDKEMADILKNK